MSVLSRKSPANAPTTVVIIANDHQAGIRHYGAKAITPHRAGPTRGYAMLIRTELPSGESIFICLSRLSAQHWSTQQVAQLSYR